MDLHISVSLIDLLALAWAGGRPAADLFIRDCKVAFDPSEEDPCFGRLTLELIKPCHFLDGKRCRDYPGRPIACALFPESRFVTGEVDLKAVVGEVLEGATPSAEGIVRLPLQRLEMLLWERFSRGGYIDEWKTKIERLDEAGLGPLEGVKRTIDQTASVTQGSPVGWLISLTGTN